MKIPLIALLLVSTSAAASTESARWAAQAGRVTIARDDFGIAHVKGKSDADAVFAMMYAQAEDDFNRVETNLINAQGRLAEAEGKAAIWRDLRMKMFIAPDALQADYARSPAWLKALMVAWADGLNFYLARHPEVKPRVIGRFEPWMALSFSEGSIGGDIEHVSLGQLEGLHDGKAVALSAVETGAKRLEPSGSNGFAIAPSHTRNGNALLWINPHTSFFFRSEARVRSDAGLDAYGASTWGQFFVYQGFNATAGWMHTSSGADNVDEYVETVRQAGGGHEDRFGDKWLPVTVKRIAVPYRTAAGMARRVFDVGYTRHGPVVRSSGGKWVTISLMHKPVAALEQSFLRTKAKDLAGFLKVAELKANSSNNTIFADSKGAIAYLHPQFMPVRSDRFDFGKPVDGSDPATGWRGEHKLSELPQVLSPRNGWVTNTNNWPWTAAGADSPKAADYPRYMDEAGENPRGPNAVRLLSARRDFTPETLMAAAYDPYLPAFADLVPTLLAAVDRLPAEDARRAALAGPVAALRGWDFNSGEESVATTLAMFWGNALFDRYGEAAKADEMALVPWLVAKVPDEARIAAFAQGVAKLTADFGKWETVWGAVNRYQRIDGAVEQRFDDAKPSLPIGLASAEWGALAAFGKPPAGTKKWYGTHGNSFVAVVEFGRQVSARAVSVGGQSGDPASPHFGDQAERYRRHDFRRVYFSDAELAGYVTRRYRPGQEQAALPRQ